MQAYKSKQTALQTPTAERGELKKETASCKPASRLLTEAGLELCSLIHLASQISKFHQIPIHSRAQAMAHTPLLHQGFMATLVNHSHRRLHLPRSRLLFLDSSLLQSHGLGDFAEAQRFLHYLFLQTGFTHALRFQIGSC